MSFPGSAIGAGRAVTLKEEVSLHIPNEAVIKYTVFVFGDATGLKTIGFDKLSEGSQLKD
jgi:hypothetical protein